MKRFHVHVAVNDLDKSIAFYSAMFGEQPSVVKPDYAKWMLDDPRINFAISHRGQAPGVNHLGMQAEDDAELEAIHANLQKADTTVVAEQGCAMLLRDVGQVLGDRPAGNRLGELPVAGFHTAVREQ